MRLVAILLASATLASCGVVTAKDAGPTATRNYAIGGFEKIEVAGPYDVAVTSGGQPSVRATGGSNRLDELVVEVEDGTLKIHPKSHSGISWAWGGHSNGTVRIDVSAPDGLREAMLAGSGGMQIDKVQAPSFSGSVAGSGSLQLAQLAAQDVSFSIAGSGGIRANGGTATRSKYEIAGSGDIQASGMRAQDAKVEIAGSGSVAAHATATAKVEILGSGDVTISGGARCEIEKHGSGDVRCS
ncbi:head GIN domain-containing protein [Sphingomonas ginkgonis]|nr:head GIN domain-containing protein [Sphingomonas ginkgonis]